MNKTLNYKDLPITQRVFELVETVNTVIQTFPKTSQGRTISDQLFRAATSIGANVAEGRGCDVGKEHERYLRIARASANETDYWIHVAYKCELLTEPEQAKMLSLVDECLRMLSTMITKLRANQNNILREQSSNYWSETSAEIVDDDVL